MYLNKKRKARLWSSGLLSLNCFYKFCIRKVIQDFKFCNSFYLQVLESHNKKGKTSTLENENPGNVYELTTRSESILLQKISFISVLGFIIKKQKNKFLIRAYLIRSIQSLALKCLVISLLCLIYYEKKTKM